MGKKINSEKLFKKSMIILAIIAGIISLIQYTDYKIKTMSQAMKFWGFWQWIIIIFCLILFTLSLIPGTLKFLESTEIENEDEQCKLVGNGIRWFALSFIIMCFTIIVPVRQFDKFKITSCSTYLKHIKPINQEQVYNYFIKTKTNENTINPFYRFLHTVTQEDLIPYTKVTLNNSNVEEACFYGDVILNNSQLANSCIGGNLILKSNSIIKDNIVLKGTVIIDKSWKTDFSTLRVLDNKKIKYKEIGENNE